MAVPAMVVLVADASSETQICALCDAVAAVQVGVQQRFKYQ
jgi:hypothetical protein